MEKFYVKRFLSLLLVVVLILPSTVFAQGDDALKIKSVYFQDETDNMVFVDFEKAIESAMDGDQALYSALKEYVGVAELKGRKLYVETSDGKFWDYALAMKDNQFLLQNIVQAKKYYVKDKIEFSHELKLVNGKPGIVEKEEPVDPEPDPEKVYLKKINPVGQVSVEIGTSQEEVLALLSPTTTIVDSKEEVHTVDLTWTIENYNKDLEGEYKALGRFELPQGIENTGNLDLVVESLVKLVGIPAEESPEAIEKVFIFKSEITANVYANVEIKSAYVSRVKSVNVGNSIGFQLEDQPSMWRILLDKEMTNEELLKIIKVEMEDGQPGEKPYIEFIEDSLLGPSFGLGKVLVKADFAKKYPSVSQYAVLYYLGKDNKLSVLTSKVDLGKPTVDYVFYKPGQNKMSIVLYDDHGNVVKVVHEFDIR